MSILVKLILICQIKDDIIPQLIPLIWIFSFLIVLFIFLKLIIIYGNFMNFVFLKKLVSNFKIINKWFW